MGRDLGGNLQVKRLFDLITPKFAISRANFMGVSVFGICIKWLGYSVGITFNFRDMEKP